MFNFPSIKTVYTRLDDAKSDSDDTIEGEDVSSPNHPDSVRYQQSRRWFESPTIHIAILGTELLLLAILLAGYAVLYRSSHGLVPANGSLDGLREIASTYNTTMTFHNQSDLLRSSHEADTYWAKLLESGGVVSLNTDWALQSGLPESASSPTDSTQSIYQVDSFHALHCMVRQTWCTSGGRHLLISYQNAIRQMLMSPTPPPYTEIHMLHCLDYVRHELLCHPDLTLVTTYDLEEFVLDGTHKCKDYGAMLDWVDRHRWKEFPEWLQTKDAVK